jgi:hypothetical protein
VTNSSASRSKTEGGRDREGEGLVRDTTFRGERENFLVEDIKGSRQCPLELQA